MTGRVNCKLCSCASKCTTNAHSLQTAISVKFPQKCTLTLFFRMYGNFSTFGGFRYVSKLGRNVGMLELVGPLFGEVEGMQKNT